MKTVMNATGKHAEFYRAYLGDDRSLPQVTVLLATIVALSLLVYLLGAAGPLPKVETAQSRPHAGVDARGAPGVIGLRKENAVQPSHAR